MTRNTWKLTLSHPIALLGLMVSATTTLLSQPAWQRTTDYPVAAYQYDVVENDGHIYVLGGYSGTRLADCHFAVVNPDGSLGPWTATTPLPQADQGPGVAVYEGRIYVALENGGLYYTEIQGDGSLGPWIRAQSVPASRSYRMVLKAYKGYLYVVGGETYNSTVRYATVNADGSLGAWSTTTPMPEGRQHQSVHFFNDRLYIAGGISGGTILRTAFSAQVNADGTMGAWRQEASLPTTLWQHSSLQVNNEVFLFGGLTGYSGGAVTTIYRGTINSDSTLSGWMVVDTMPSSYVLAPGTVFAPSSGEVYVIGGAGFVTPARTDVVWRKAFALPANQPPIARCKDVTVSAGPDCSADASIDDGSFDPDVGDTLTLSQSPAGPYPLGSTTVLLTVSDSHGASDSCAAIITVADTAPPSIAAPAAVLVNTDPSKCEASNVELGTPVSADNCGVANVFNDAPAVFAKGVTTVTWTVSDTSGNQSTATQPVTVEDHENPTITAPADVLIASDAGSCQATMVALGTPTTADNCAVASVANEHPSTTFPLGETFVTWMVSDSSANVATALQKVTVLASVGATFLPPLAGQPVANKIRHGQVVPHKVVLANCSGATVTAGVTVKLKVQGVDAADGAVFQDVIEDAAGVGSDGTVTADGIMVLTEGNYQFNLDTSNFGDPNTLASLSRYYRSTVTVIDNATLLVLGTASVNLETRD